MPIIRSRGWVAAPIEEVFAFFDDPANLDRLMPPPVRIRPVRVDPMPPQAGSLIEFRYAAAPGSRIGSISMWGRTAQWEPWSTRSPAC